MARVTASVIVGKGLSPDQMLATLKWESNALLEVLVGDVTRFNLRADYSYDSLKLESIERHGRSSRYTLRYSFGWEAYWGCRDMNDGDIVSDEIEFIYKDGAATFSREHVERRSTYEEF